MVAANSILDNTFELAIFFHIVYATLGETWLEMDYSAIPAVLFTYPQYGGVFEILCKKWTLLTCRLLLGPNQPGRHRTTPHRYP